MKTGEVENSQDSTLERSIKGVLVSQCIAVVAVVVGIMLFYFLQGDDAVAMKLKAAIYGSVLAIAGTILSARSVRRFSQAASKTGNSAMLPVFFGLLNKLVVVGGGIAFGLIVLGLEPILVVTGYLVVQTAAASQLIMNHG